MKLTDLPQEILDEIFYLLFPRFKEHRLEISSVFPNARLVCKRFDTTIIGCFLRKIRKIRKVETGLGLVFSSTRITRPKLLFLTRLLSQSVANAAVGGGTGNCQLVNEMVQAAEDASALLIPQMSDRKAGSLKYRHGLVQAAMGEMGIWKTITALSKKDNTPSEKIAKITPIERGIIAAASTGSISDLQLLINHPGASPTYGHFHFGTPLQCAAFGGHEAMVRFLMSLEEVQLDSQNQDGNTALHCAAIANHENIVRLLLDGGAGIDFQNSNQQTPLMCAVAFGYESMVGLLVEKGANPNLPDWAGKAPLTLAAMNGDEKVVRQLLKSVSIDVNPRGTEQAALSIAMRKNLPVIIDMLLRSPSMDMHKWDRNSPRPLGWACREGHEAIVRLLLDSFKLSELETFETKMATAFEAAAYSNHGGILKMLLESEYVNAKHLKLKGGAMLHSAAERNNVETMKVLLADVQVDPNARHSFSRTPLATAALEGSSEAVALLLSRDDVDRNAVDKRGITPLGCACEKNIPAIAEALLNDPRVQIHYRDKRDMTPLMMAAQHENNRVVEVILRRERELNILTADDIRRAIKYCRHRRPWQHREETLALLYAEMTRMGEDLDDGKVREELRMLSMRLVN